MTSQVHRIAKWDTVFERAESRKLKHLTWVAMPVGFTSHGYQSLLDEFEDDAPAAYGAWCALVGVAACCSHRGTLASGRGIPLTIPRIARMTGFPADLYERLFRWAVRPDIGWLDIVGPEELEEMLGENLCIYGENDTSGESPDDPPACRENPPATEQNRTVQNKTEQDREGGAGKPAALDDEEQLREWLVWWNTLRGNKPPLVPCGASVEPPSAAVAKAWKAVLRDGKLRKLVTDRDALEREIRASTFVRDAGWFRPEKVLAGKNRDGEWIVRKLLEGGFRDALSKHGEASDSRNNTEATGRGSLFAAG